ncbi:MAG: hypothetical protein AAF696_39405, partial [Bacteroidota bacterium]
ASNNEDEKSGISLFDDIKTELAQKICRSHSNYFESEDTPFLLVKGDLSGIQKFIYSEIDMSEAGNTRELSKKLRGRSFYIAILTDLIADLVIDHIGLAAPNLLYSGGGHFVLVAPNHPEVLQILSSINQKVNLFLHKHIGGRIDLILGSQACGKDLFEQTSTYYPKLSQQISKLKLQKHKSYLSQIIHGSHSLKNREINFQDDGRMGRFLPHSEILIELRTTKPINESEKANSSLVSYFEFEDIYRYLFMPRIKYGKGEVYDKLNEIIQENWTSEISEIIVHRVNNTDFLDPAALIYPKYPNFPISFGYVLVGTEAPKKTDEDGKLDVMDFSELSEKYIELDEKDSTSKELDLDFNRLGIMRLDLDNLGNIFAKGLGENPSFKRVSTLSRELSLFFSGYFNSIARKRRMYVTYSGGDDAFVVSSWLNTMHFATDLHKHFQKFVCHNQDLTFSSGIFICSPHFPVAKFASITAEEESKAKSFKRVLDGKEISKNAMSAFNHTLSWDEYPRMLG